MDERFVQRRNYEDTFINKSYDVNIGENLETISPSVKSTRRKSSFIIKNLYKELNSQEVNNFYEKL